MVRRIIVPTNRQPVDTQERLLGGFHKPLTNLHGDIATGENALSDLHSPLSRLDRELGIA